MRSSCCGSRRPRARGRRRRCRSGGGGGHAARRDGGSGWTLGKAGGVGRSRPRGGGERRCDRRARERAGGRGEGSRVVSPAPRGEACAGPCAPIRPRRRRADDRAREPDGRHRARAERRGAAARERGGAARRQLQPGADRRARRRRAHALRLCGARARPAGVPRGAARLDDGFAVADGGARAGTASRAPDVERHARGAVEEGQGRHPRHRGGGRGRAGRVAGRRRGELGLGGANRRTAAGPSAIPAWTSGPTSARPCV